MDTSLLSNDNSPSSVMTGGGGGLGGLFYAAQHAFRAGVAATAAQQQHQQRDSSAGTSAPFNVSLNLLSAFEGSNLRKHLLASTVYMTKVPMGLPHSVLRKLFLCFGEFNKVRIYEEKKQLVGSNSNNNNNNSLLFAKTSPTGGQSSASAASTTATTTSGGASAASGLGGNRGHFGFVEFVIPASSKAMVDFFRNPTDSVQQKMGITSEQMSEILSMRVSFARSCIHDHDPHDALFDCSDISPNDVDSPGRRVKVCTFGLEFSK